ncbi:hypothetical protein C1H46_000200 [Malus baccata]|uniref:Uncharacterized protein n=1 Tax=Malus baccata TaxID=106549 RepID=A0A540NTD1_MALBA|nr:hypothetical protein C1H46_000200 [Malus baccata]
MGRTPSKPLVDLSSLSLRLCRNLGHPEGTQTQSRTSRSASSVLFSAGATQFRQPLDPCPSSPTSHSPPLLTSIASSNSWQQTSLFFDAVSNPTRPLVLVDSQETGVQLVHTLMACAEAGKIISMISEFACVGTCVELKDRDVGRSAVKDRRAAHAVVERGRQITRDWDAPASL